ncbi:MAG: SPOR domain-containing protein [Pseudomonadota bacterium]
MDTGLKQRLIGAAVLVALAVIFLPMLVKGPAPDSGVSDVSLKMPDAPEGELETRELPLVMPGEVPKGGAVGMDATPVDRPATAATPATDSATAPPDPNAPADPAAPPATPAVDPLPPTTAAGDYAVHFGAYASQKGADTVVALAKAAGLPAYSESTTVNGKPAFRVRIGPYATRAEAEIVRVKALEVRSDVPVKVVALDAEPVPAPSPAVAATEPAKPVAPPKAAEPRPEPKPLPKPADKPSEPKPVAAKPAETKPAPAPAKPPAAKPATSPAAAKVGFAVQVGAFGDATEAGAMREKLRAAGFTAFTETVDTDKGKLTRVRVGPVVDRAAADQLKSQIQARTGIDGIVRPHP